MTAYFLVRARIDDVAVKDDFDRWYQDEHLPDALKTFKAKRAWRGWSEADSSVHYAFYEFDNVADARAIQGSDGLEHLAAEFDRLWRNKVTRSRDVVEAIQTLGI